MIDVHYLRRLHIFGQLLDVNALNALNYLDSPLLSRQQHYQLFEMTTINHKS